MVWTCEKCGRTFARNRQSHSCAAVYPLDALFPGAKAQWLPLYHALKAQVHMRQGDFEEYVCSSCIMWKHLSTFASIKPTAQCLEVEFIADRLYPERNPKYTLQISAHRVGHFVAVVDEGDFPDVLDWIDQSYALTLMGITRGRK